MCTNMENVIDVKHIKIFYYIIIMLTEELIKENQLLKEGKGIEDATLLAAEASREHTANFARRGEWGTVLNSTIPYINAGIQGARSLRNSIIKRPLQTGAMLAI